MKFSEQVKNCFNPLLVFVTLNICGDTTSCLEKMLKSGFDGISIASHVNITEAKQLQAELNIPTRIYGNISTEGTLFMEKPKDVINDTLDTLGKEWTY